MFVTSCFVCFLLYANCVCFCMGCIVLVPLNVTQSALSATFSGVLLHVHELWLQPDHLRLAQQLVPGRLQADPVSAFKLCYQRWWVLLYYRIIITSVKCTISLCGSFTLCSY